MSSDHFKPLRSDVSAIKQMALHDTFPIASCYAENHHQFLTVTSSPLVSRDILEKLLAITEQELYDHMVAAVGIKETEEVVAERTWLRYKATILRKVLSTPGDFAFLKYSKNPAAPYWLLNVMFSAVNTIDAWCYLRMQVASEPGLLLSHTPTIEQLQKMIVATGVFYEHEEFTAALRTMVYIARNGWSKYLWR
jgi:hypothetical protein